MDEVTAVRLMREGLGPRAVEPPPAVTERVRAEIRRGAGRRRRVLARFPGAVRGAGRPRRRQALVALAVPALALVAVLAVVVRDPTTSPPPAGGTTTRPASAPEPVPAASDMIAKGPTTSLDSRSLLLAAARQAAGAAPASGSGRFVYVRQTGLSYYEQPEGTPRYARGTQESWVSVDGTRPGLLFRYGQTAMQDDTPDSRLPDSLERLDPCPGPPIADVTTQGFPGNYCDGPGAVTDIPTSAAGALAYLRQGRAWASWQPFVDQRPESARRRASDLEVFENANQLSLRHLVPPRSLAAVYEALATLPGVQVVRDARSATGRVGVAVGIVDPEQQTRFELIFDATTHRFLGNRLVALTPVAGERNRVVGASSILETALVDDAGLRPDGSRVTR